MKQLLITALFFGIAFAVRGQEESQKRIGLGVFVSPELNTSTLKGKFFNESVQPVFGISTGVEMNATFGNHFVLRAGLGYGQKGFNYSINDLYFGDDIDPNTGFIDQSSVIYNVSLHEFFLPVSVHYKFKKPVFVGGGIDFSIPVQSSAYRITTKASGPVGERERINPDAAKTNIALTISAGYRFKLAATYHLLVEPTLKYYFFALGLNNGNIVSAGLKTTFWIGGR